MSQIRWILAQNRHHHFHHGHCWAISIKSLKRDTRQQSTVIKFETIVAMALTNRFALSFLWFVVQYGQKGHCHGQLDERRLSLLVVHKLLNLRYFGLLTCQFDLEIEHKIIVLTKMVRV
jgi:hypothetical protein